MSPKTLTKRSLVTKQSVLDRDQDEDIHREPDSSEDDGPNRADLITTKFTKRSENVPPKKSALERRREASIIASYKRARVALPKDNETKSTGPIKTHRGRTTPSSSQPSSSAKRKSQDDESMPLKLGKGMEDEFGRTVIKKAKKTNIFGRNKTFKAQSSGFKSIDPLSDEDEPSQPFIKPDSSVTPRKSLSFINPDLTPEKSDASAGGSFKKPDPDTTQRSASPAKEYRGFIVPDIDSDDSFDAPNIKPGTTLLSPSKDNQKIASNRSSQAFGEILQSNGLGLDKDVITNACDFLAGNSEETILPASRTTVEKVDSEILCSMTEEARCPMCNAPVDPDDLRVFGSINNIRKQEKFCRSHRKKTAEDEWAIKEYPKIDWDILDSRIAKHHSFIKKLIYGEGSHYRDILNEKVNAGKDRSLLTTTTNLTPGYYGARGLRIMSENIMQKFTPLLKKQMVKDRLMSSRGFTPYVQAVLVPEVAVLLIMDDMSVGIEEARIILHNSAGVGELLHEELREVVRKRTEDSENSDE